MTDKFKYKSKIFISLIVFGAIVALFSFFIFIPFLRDIEESKEEYSSQKEKKALLEYKRLNLDSLKESYEKAEKEIEVIENAFFDSNNPSQALSYLEEKSEKYGLGDLSISEISYFENEKPWPCFSFQVSFVSDFDSFSRFLEEIENAPLMLEIQSLSLGKEGENVKASIFIKFFTK
jgi:Tfp pilus assembly protein PilO